MKTLNLDSLAKVTRTITLGGAIYEVEEMTVENFIETTKAAEALEKKKEATEADKIEATVSMIARSIPAMPVEKLRKLNFDQLLTVSRFLRGELDDEKAPAEEGADAGN